MYTQESDYKEMVAKVKELGLETASNKKADIIEVLNAAATAIEEVEEVVETRGRKINPNSARQKRLAEMENNKIDGVSRRGRRPDPNSAWNIRQRELEEKRAAGELSLGRPVDPDSERQKRLAKKGKVKLGRPVTVKEEPIIETETPLVEGETPLVEAVEIEVVTEVEVTEVEKGNDKA